MYQILSHHIQIQTWRFFAPPAYSRATRAASHLFIFLVMESCWSKILLQGACPCLPPTSVFEHEWSNQPTMLAILPLTVKLQLVATQ